MNGKPNQGRRSCLPADGWARAEPRRRNAENTEQASDGQRSRSARPRPAPHPGCRHLPSFPPRGDGEETQRRTALAPKEASPPLPSFLPPPHSACPVVAYVPPSIPHHNDGRFLPAFRRLSLSPSLSLRSAAPAPIGEGRKEEGERKKELLFFRRQAVGLVTMDPPGSGLPTPPRSPASIRGRRPTWRRCWC